MSNIEANAPKILLLGEVGSGKTYSSALIAKENLEVFYLFTEPGHDTLASLPANLKQLIGTRIHYRYIPAASTPFARLIEEADKVNKFTFEMLAKSPEGNREFANEFKAILQGMMNYVSDVDGKNYGNAETWGTNKVLVIDSLTGICTAAMRLVVGERIALGMHHWGSAMKIVEAFIQKITQGLRCWVILTAHPEREVDEVTGGTAVYPAALGRKLSPKIGRNFSELIECFQTDEGFYWRNQGGKATLKRRLLPATSKMVPDWKQIVQNALSTQTSVNNMNEVSKS